MSIDRLCALMIPGLLHGLRPLKNSTRWVRLVCLGSWIRNCRGCKWTIRGQELNAEMRDALSLPYRAANDYFSSTVWIDIIFIVETYYLNVSFLKMFDETDYVKRIENGAKTGIYGFVSIKSAQISRSRQSREKSSSMPLERAREHESSGALGSYWASP
ncbi:hypothetical protein Tco_0204343 [Tanacetum coccineum]